MAVWNTSAWVSRRVVSEHDIAATKQFEKKDTDSIPGIQPVYKSLYTCSEV